MAEKMIHNQVISDVSSQTHTIQRNVLENDKLSFHNDRKLYTPSDFTVSDSTGECEIVASSRDTDILANLLDGKREHLSSAFDSWIVKLLENGKTKTDDLNEKVKMTLSQQLQEGLLNYYEYIDLEYIGRVWKELLNKLNMYKLGSTCCKKDILTSLLELYELRQISKEQFIETVLQSRML